MDEWTLTEKMQGFIGASAPFIAGMFGIQIYEYFITSMNYNNADIYWPIALSCVAYVLVMSVAGFSLLMALERKFGQRLESSRNASLVLGLGIAIGILALLHRMAFVVIPA